MTASPLPVKRYRRTRWNDAGEVRCSRCERFQPTSAYRTFVERKTGRTYPRGECRSCEAVRRQRNLASMDDERWEALLARRRHRERSARLRRSAQARRDRAWARDWALGVFRRAGLTQGETARAIGTHPTNIRNWARGGVPDPVMTDRLLDAATRFLAEAEAAA